MEEQKTNVPLVSVLITTYNQELYIADALEGALMQRTDFPYEIIIGEDCSTDGTREICEAYQARFPDRIILLANEKNKGVLRNYFDSFLQCRGKYIADCAGDDYWLDPMKMQKEVDILETHPDVMLVHTNWREYHQQSRTFVRDARGKKGGWKEKIQAGDDAIRRLIIQRNCPYAFLSSAIYRRENLLKDYLENPYLFNSEELPCEDFQIWFTLQRQGLFYYLDEETSVYRILQHSVSNDDSFQKQFDFAYGLFFLRLYIIRYYHVSVEYAREYQYSELSNMMMLAFRTRIPSNACRVISLAKEHDIPISPRNKVLYTICTYKILSLLAWYLRRIYLYLKSFRKNKINA